MTRRTYRGVEVGPLTVILHKTVRVPAGETPAGLPPSLGSFEVMRVEEYSSVCPENWDRNGYFIPIEEKEAMWMSLSPKGTLAVTISAGGLNCINGEKVSPTLTGDGYVVCPPQPWLDGWKAEDGKVYQFCGTEFKQGEGLTVAEQIIGDESTDGGIEIRVFEPIDPESIRPAYTPSQFSYGGEEGVYESCLCASPSMKSVRAFSAAVPEMGLGKGGAIEQKIYPDPHGIEVWKNEPTAVTHIYMVAASVWSEMCRKLATEIVDADDYTGPWFGLKDEHLGDTPGSPKFKEIASVFDAPSN